MNQYIRALMNDGWHCSIRMPTLKAILKQSSVVAADPKPSVPHNEDAGLVELQAVFFYMQNTQVRIVPINDRGKQPRLSGVVHPSSEHKNGDSYCGPSAVA